MLEGAMGNDNQLIRADLDTLEQVHVDDLTLTEAIKWLYMRFRDRCIGERFDRIRNEFLKQFQTGWRWPSFKETTQNTMSWKNYIAELV